MKVLHLLTGLGVGGTEKHLLKILPLMKETENIVCALTSHKETGIKLQHLGIKVYYLSSDKNGIFGLFTAINNFRKIIRKEHPDILCTYLIHSDIFGRIFGRMFGVKKIICNIRVALDEGYLKEVGRVLLFLEKITSSMTDLYICNSESGKVSLSKVQGVSLDRIQVIVNGIDMHKIDAIVTNASTISKKRKALGLLKKDFFIVCVGRLHDQKGQIYLIRAMSKVLAKNSFVKLFLIGEGENRKEYLSEIRALGLSRAIILLGARDDVLEMLKSADLFVLPTNYEGMSNSILEAMACKVPIITTNIPENKELLHNNNDGLLIVPKDSERLTESILWALNHNSKMRSFAKNASKKIGNYDIQTTAVLFEQQYQNMLREHILRGHHVRN